MGLRPSAVVDGQFPQFDGSFQVSEISGLSHFAIATRFVYGLQKPDAAVPAFQASSRLNPNFIWPHEMLASIYDQAKRQDEAMREYQAALDIYQGVHPVNPMELPNSAFVVQNLLERSGTKTCSASELRSFNRTVKRDGTRAGELALFGGTFHAT